MAIDKARRAWREGERGGGLDRNGRLARECYVRAITLEQQQQYNDGGGPYRYDEDEDDEDDGDDAANGGGIHASSSRNTFHFIGVINPAEEQYPLRRTFSQSNADPAFLIDIDKIEY